MSSFSAYIMSIVGCICLTTLVDILLPNGETQKYVKGICSLLIFSVILSPIPKLIYALEPDYKETSVLEEIEYSAQNVDFLIKIKQKECEMIKNKCIKELENEGIENLCIEVISTYSTKFEILKIVVDKKNIVIKPDAENIDIVTVIKSVVSKYFNLDDSLVEVIN